MNTDRISQYQPEVSQPSKQQKKVVVKVRKSTWLTKGEKVIWSFFAFVLILASMYIVSYSSTTDTLNREVLDLEKQVQAQHLDNETLLVEISELSKPERITKIAKENGLTIQDAQVKWATNSNK